MTSCPRSFTHLNDGDLLGEVSRLAAGERQATGDLIAALTELDERRLYLREGCSSLFTYCTQVLHLSEHAAYGRIQAARAARQYPLIIPMLVDGSVHLTTIVLLAPHLTAENHAALLASARHRSKRDVELLVARIRPLPAVRSSVRKLPPPKIAERRLEGLTDAPQPIENRTLLGQPQPVVAAHPLQPPTRRTVVSPLTPERYKIQMTVGRETWEKLRLAQDLLRHAIPTGDPAAILDRALTTLLAALMSRKTGATDRPRTAVTRTTDSRHIPAAVRRRVWQRDGGRCAFVGSAGRCTETGFIEFHHVVPYAIDGESTVENLELRCRAHNTYEAEQYFGAMQSLFAKEAHALFS